MSGTPADRLAMALKQLGADTAFGVPGGGPNLDVIGAMADNGIDFVLTHGETAACIMAAVYGHLTGRPASAVVTRGPGAASAVNGAAQATLDRHPLILVTDTVPAESSARVPHQRLDQRTMLAPACKASLTLGATGPVDDLSHRLGAALRAPAGAVHVDYDASAPHDDPSLEPGTNRGTDRASAPVVAEVEQMVADAEHPIVIVGLAATTVTSGDLTATLERFNAPVLTTYQAIGAIPTEHRLAAGLFTNGASERDLLNRADLIVAIGLDMVEPIPAPWTFAAPVVSLTPTPTTDPYLPITVELIGDPARLADAVLGAGDRWPNTAGADHRERVRSQLRAVPPAADPSPAERPALRPTEVVDVVSANRPDSLTTTVDAGAHFLAIMPFWPVEAPNRLLISNGLATMGFAVPAAIAAAIARPGEPVLCLVGDGGLGMTVAELETMARLQLPITVVVFNDSALSLIKIKQRPNHGGDGVVSYRTTDFAAMAAGLGVHGRTADSADALADALATGWDRPRLIDVAVDPSDYSHLIEVTRG